MSRPWLFTTLLLPGCIEVNPLYTTTEMVPPPDTATTAGTASAGDSSSSSSTTSASMMASTTVSDATSTTAVEPGTTSGTSGTTTTATSSSGDSDTGTDTVETTGGPPAFPETCAEVKAADPDAVDGDKTLYIAADPQKPWTAYCHDMAGEPAEYLPLVAVADGRNFSQYTAGGQAVGTDVRTEFTRVAIDPITLLVDIDDLTFSSSSGQIMQNNNMVTSMPYGVAQSCDDAASGLANIDLSDTPFKLVEAFCTGGFAPQGMVMLGQDDQIADLIGGGFCGWTAPLAEDCPINPSKQLNGPILDLAYVGP